MLSGSRPEVKVPQTKSEDGLKDEGPHSSTSEVQLPTEVRRSTDWRERESYIGHQKVTPEYRAYQKLMDQIHDCPDERTSDIRKDESPPFTEDGHKAKDLWARNRNCKYSC